MEATTQYKLKNTINLDIRQDGNKFIGETGYFTINAKDKVECDNSELKLYLKNGSSFNTPFISSKQLDYKFVYNSNLYANLIIINIYEEKTFDEILNDKSDSKHTHLMQDITDYTLPDMSQYATKEQLSELSESQNLVYDWAKQPTKPTYTAFEVGALSNSTFIPTKTSDIENDSDFATNSSITTLRNIINGKSTGYVFNTYQNLLDWLDISENRAGLRQGDNLYIIDVDVPDYWWDGTQIQQLETQKCDLTNLATKTELATKQNVIPDLETIRYGAAAGATALQSIPSEYATKEYVNTNYLQNKKDNTSINLSDDTISITKSNDTQYLTKSFCIKNENGSYKYYNTTSSGEIKIDNIFDDIGIAKKEHSHSEYSLTTHNHDDKYSDINHEHSEYLTEHQDISNKVDKEEGKGLFSGNYNDLSNKPAIPSIEGLASQTWVIQQGYITSSTADFASSTHTHTLSDITDYIAPTIDSIGAAEKNHTHDIYLTITNAEQNYATKTEIQNFITESDLPDYSNTYQPKGNYITTDNIYNYSNYYALKTHSHTLDSLGAASSTHNHNDLYSVLGHDHDSVYSSLEHNHNDLYSAINHNHDTKYSTINHTHSEYALSDDLSSYRYEITNLLNQIVYGIVAE